MAVGGYWPAVLCSWVMVTVGMYLLIITVSSLKCDLHDGYVPVLWLWGWLAGSAL